MELPFSALAISGPDAMAIAAAQLRRTDRQSLCAVGTHLSSKGMQAIFFRPEIAGTSAADQLSQRVEPEKERGL
jgi:hypothetical protein